MKIGACQKHQHLTERQKYQQIEHPTSMSKRSLKSLMSKSHSLMPKTPAWMSKWPRVMQAWLSKLQM